MRGHRFLAFDLGAESGRATVGTFDGERLSLEEVHRFLNEPVEICGAVYWDVLALYNHMLKALRICSERFGDSVEGVGIDTWAVDFGLLAADGTLLQNPVHYRDRRTEGLAEEIMRRIPAPKLFARTGLPFSPMQTLGQLFSMRLRGSPILASAATLLLMPDLLGYFLTGIKRCERSAAVMTQLYEAPSREWSEEILRLFDLPFPIMPPLADSASVLGDLSDAVVADTGLPRTQVIMPCTHDTSSAAAGVPGAGDNWAFLSSGTWSVLGTLTPQWVNSPAALSAGFGSELTLGGFFLCRNLWGLWLLQQARHAWQREGKAYSYQELSQFAERLPTAGTLIDPSHACFFAPENMLLAIRDYCRQTSQSPPEGPGEVTRCILDSLALAYRQALDQLSAIMEKRFDVLHVVGGGSLNSLLCQKTANATRTLVWAGPADATVAGNILGQALVLGYVASPQEIREVIRRSTAMQEYEPEDTALWEDRYAEYLKILAKTRS
jgi:sugar (pentulose or hexulose) kinase